MKQAAATDPEALGPALLEPGGAAPRALLEKRPARLLLDVARCYALIAGAFVLLAALPSAGAALLAFVVIGTQQYALSVLTHEGNHALLFRSRRANDLFAQFVLCAPVGADLLGERANHLAHHRHLATGDDPDRFLYVAADKATRPALLLFLTGLTTFPRALAKALRGRGAPRRAAAGPSFLARRWPTFVVQGAIAGALALVFPWWFYFVFWMGPIYPLVFVPHKVRMFCEHAQPLLPDEAGDARRLVTYRPGPVERFLMSPFNLHLHAEHHLFPAVPYYHLPEVAPLVVGHPALEVRASYLGFVWRYFRALPLVVRSEAARAPSPATPP